MRSATALELAVLASLARTETLRVKVANGSGTMIDLSSWVEAYSIDGDKDQPVGGATVSFTRASGTAQSFSPLRTDSTLNLLDDHVTYGPQLDINRAITIELATTAIGAMVMAGDYKLLFKGTIDVVDFEQTPVTVTCRDRGAQIVDRKIESPAPYGSLAGIAVETVMQSELDAIFGGGVIPLYTPVSPSYLISPAFQQQIMSEMDAQVALAQLPGFDVRYKWDDGTSAFRFTLSNPPRSKTAPDYTFGPSGYYNVTKLSLDITNIRNVVIVNYPDSADFGNRHTLTVSDAPSIAKYGRRTLIITEDDTSPINTSAEATTLANAALADLKDPKADQEVELPLFWPGDLDDLYRFSPNGVHYNTNQDLAVVQITHSGAMTSSGMVHRTHVKVRGSPIGQYTEWLTRGGAIGGGGSGGAAKPPVPFIIPLGTEANDLTWDLRFYATYGSGGGGTNLTYTITLKKSFGAATTLDSGNASAFPKNLTVTRDARYAAVLTFTVTDAATGMVGMETYAIPAVTSNIINPSFNLIGGAIDPGSVGPTQTQARFNARVWNTTNQSIANITNTILQWDSEFYDIGGLHTTGSKLTIPAGGGSGNWLVMGVVEWAGNATGSRQVQIIKNSSTIVANKREVAFSDGGLGNIQPIVGLADFPAVGDYYELNVFQSSGGSLNVLITSSWFGIIYLW